ncbi:class I SAM-dependent methyltransferase [Marinomonas ostreistagni]|uniref:Ribosomal RNA small subunit methyltransferase J n=1 Tax=Marinomonas ostreistagni TaxID=359209 RepID=A0ABS0ZAN9_9GAMM|nr:class I SAM-dependent methyltransferase [Marinomonas ostreistagni]MBJ7550707.1 class I SAM-dependent methyltransferase [Marinomonas ostreistagni]
MFTPSTLAVAYRNSETHIRDLAQRLQLPKYRLTSELKFVTDYDYLLMHQDDALVIAKTGKGAPKPVSVELASGAVDHRRKFGGGKGQDIAKACGLTKRQGLTIFDATAGLGRDAFVLASLGCNVTLYERVGFVRELLCDGVDRAKMVVDIADIMERISLALDTIFEVEEEECVDVVYLDPMFPHNDKSSAAVKKEMAFFRDLVGHDADADSLLPKAMLLARYRVVVKRPKGAPYLNGEEPSFRLDGKSGRFDIYVKRSLDHN